MGSSDDDSDPFEDDGISEASSSSSSSSVDEEEELWFDLDLQRVKENSTLTKKLAGYGYYERIQNMTDEEWQEIGRDISKNTHLKKLRLCEGALNDHKTLFLFRGLTGSSSIKDLRLHENGLSVAGIRSMVPFLQNANKLTMVDLHDDNIKSEGFNVLFRALRDSPIEALSCSKCGIESIEIDRNNIPRAVKYLILNDNQINASGCRELAKLLRRENATLEHLNLVKTNIDDEGIAILVDALQSNSSFNGLRVNYNDGITIEGMKLLLKLVNDVSSIKATLQSNHTLYWMTFSGYFDDVGEEIKRTIQINKENENNPDAAGKQKVIQTQLNSEKRAEMCRLQGLDHTTTPYTELGPLLLPEVLEIVGKHHGLSEFYKAFVTNVADLWMGINKEMALQRKRADVSKELKALAVKRLELEKRSAELERQKTEIDAEIAVIRQQSQPSACDVSHSSKRQRMS